MIKFMKGCAVTAAVMLVIGIVLGTASGMIMGRSSMNYFIEDFISNWSGPFGAKMREWADGSGFEANEVVIEADNDAEFAYDYENEVIEGFEEFDIKEKSMFNDRYDIYKGDVEYTFDRAESITGLDLQIGSSIFTVEDSEDGAYRVEGENVGKLQYYVENGVLSIRAIGKKGRWDDFSKTTITFYVPAGAVFDTATLYFGAGNADITRLDVKNLMVQVGAGAVTAYNVRADQMTAYVGAGDLTVDEIVCGDLDINVAAGSSSIYGTINGNAKAVSAAGSLLLELNNRYEEFNYEISCMAGSIEVDDNIFSSLNRQTKLDNSAARNMKLESAAGGISVYFN